MKRILFALGVSAIVASTLQAQELTKEERTKAIKYLEQTEAGVLAATKGLSEAQWNFKSAPDRWSIAEVAEHIAASEDLIRGNIETNVMKAPARTEKEDVKALDDLVLQRVPDRSVKRQTTEPLRPTNRFGSPKETLKHFKASRAKTLAFAKETEGLREHATDSPFGKKLDGYQWVLFLAAHSERHTKQIDEVKADPNFPKK
jgi:hypothetical protein